MAFAEALNPLKYTPEKSMHLHCLYKIFRTTWVESTTGRKQGGDEILISLNQRYAYYSHCATALPLANWPTSCMYSSFKVSNFVLSAPSLAIQIRSTLVGKTLVLILTISRSFLLARLRCTAPLILFETANPTRVMWEALTTRTKCSECNFLPALKISSKVFVLFITWSFLWLNLDTKTMLYYLSLTVKLWRPLARRLFKTACPPFVFIRARKPCLFRFFLLWGWKVRFIFLP